MIAIGPQGLDYYEPSRSHYVLTIMRKHINDQGILR